MAIKKMQGHKKSTWKTYAFTFTFRDKSGKVKLAMFDGRSIHEAEKRLRKEYGRDVIVWDTKVV